MVKLMEAKFKIFEGEDYIISQPSDWSVLIKDNEHVAFIGPKVNKAHRVGFFITRVKNANNDDASKIAQQSRSKQLDYKVLIEQNIILNEYPTLVNYTMWCDAEHKCSIYCMELFIQADDSIFILSTSISETPNRKKYEFIFDEMFQSFQILKVPELIF